MSYTSELSDIIVRLNVAGKLKVISVRLKYTNIAVAILQLFYKNGLIRGFFVEATHISVFLKYNMGKHVIKTLKMVSKPGRRIYWTLGFLSLKYNARNFSGFYIISTPRGLMTSHQCMLMAQNSGEVLLKVTY